jgi:hypothetical protein
MKRRALKAIYNFFSAIRFSWPLLQRHLEGAPSWRRSFALPADWRDHPGIGADAEPRGMRQVVDALYLLNSVRTTLSTNELFTGFVM